MEGADQVLAVRELMPVLPPTEESTCASSVVGTCTKSIPRRTHGRGKAGEIADDAAAERDHEIAALDARGDDRLAHVLERGVALRAFARRHDDAPSCRCRRP